MGRSGIRILALALLLGALLAPRDSRSDDSLDIASELARPGVKLVVVEFYATWCKPCMQAVPKWRELHEKYRREGLRFIVVSADDGVCAKPPDWSPDATLCDADGALQKQMGVTGLPMSFLYSWEGKLALKSPHVEPVERAIDAYFRDTHYKVDVEPVEVIGDRYALSGNPQRVREEVISQIRRKSKLDVVSERHTATTRREAEVCVTEFPANSTLRIKAMGYETGERMLSLELEQDGCVRAQATHPYTGTSLQEDWESLRRAIDRTTTDLLGQVVRVKGAELVGNTSGGEDWFSPEELFVLRFESNPAGVTVLVDNEPVCNATPCSRSFPRGMCSVTMLTADYITRNESVSVSRDMTLNWTLAPNFGWLTLADAPEGLEVRIDGQVAGKTPLTRHRLSPGRHVVEIASPCYEPFRAEQTITRDRENRLSANVKAREGGIEITASDESGNTLRADVFVDGVRIGAAPGRFRVNICARELVVKSEGNRDFSQRLNVKEREILPVKAVLRRGPQPLAAQGTSGMHDRFGIEWLYSQPAKLYFMKTEVTLRMYHACVEAGACKSGNHKTKNDNKNCNWGYSDRNNHPMTCVNWGGATEFCAWVGGRLPTGEEWYAEASNSGNREYPWGKEQASCLYAVIGDRDKGYSGKGCSQDSTWPVCSKPAGNSVSGLCDMAGNAWEWMSTKAGVYGVQRGGSWTTFDVLYLRASDWYHVGPGVMGDSYGFRCVREGR